MLIHLEILIISICFGNWALVASLSRLLSYVSKVKRLQDLCIIICAASPFIIFEFENNTTERV